MVSKCINKHLIKSYKPTGFENRNIIVNQETIDYLVEHLNPININLLDTMMHKVVNEDIDIKISDTLFNILAKRMPYKLLTHLKIISNEDNFWCIMEGFNKCLPKTKEEEFIIFKILLDNKYLENYIINNVKMCENFMSKVKCNKIINLLLNKFVELEIPLYGVHGRFQSQYYMGAQKFLLRFTHQIRSLKRINYDRLGYLRSLLFDNIAVINSSYCRYSEYSTLAKKILNIKYIRPF